MKLLRLLISGWMLTISWTLVGQDIHFSLFHFSPLTLNPAMTGAFEGTARVGGIYRDQWASFLPGQFTTPSFYADAPIIRGLGKNDWVGVGLVNISDKAGALEVGKSATLFSASYHRSLSRRNADHILTLGIQAGRVNRTLNPERIVLGNGIDDNLELLNFVEDRGLGMMFARDQEEENDFVDINAGLMLRSVLNDNARLEVGIAGFHLNQPRNNFITINETFTDSTFTPPRTFTPDEESTQKMLLTFHGRLRYQLTEDWTLTPGVLARTIEGSDPELALQVWAGRKINDDFTLNFGTAYRFADAAQVLIGLDYLQDLKVALSYDLNVSSLTPATNGQGGFELAASYIIRLYKQPDSTPRILCPKF